MSITATITAAILPYIEAVDNRLLWLVDNGPEMMKFPPQDDTLIHPLTGIVTYLTSILALWLFMRNRQPLDKELKWPLAIHNYFLCLVSLAMVVGFTVHVTKAILTEGLFSVYCGSSDVYQDRPFMWWGYVFYLSKYYELLDTVFLVLRKRPLSFLHVYHHAIVMFICWYALNQHIVMGWITCFNNASVHVLMYYYYAEQARGSGPIWWRKYLTSLQIVQFILDCTTSLPFGYFWYTGVKCRGSIHAWAVANFVGVSFFFLFLNFYIQNYIKEGRRKSTGSSAALWTAGKDQVKGTDNKQAVGYGKHKEGDKKKN